MINENETRLKMFESRKIKTEGEIEEDKKKVERNKNGNNKKN